MKLDRRHGIAAASEGSPPVRVLLDLTTAWNWRGRKAVGIIRTEREIALRLLRDPSLTVLPFVFHGGRLRVVDPGFALDMLEEQPPAVAVDHVAPAASPAATPPRSMLARIIRPFAALSRLCVRGALRVVPKRAREDVRQSLIHLRAAVRHLIYPAPPCAASVPAASAPATQSGPPQPDLSLVLHPQPGDVIFTCGLGWSGFDWSPIAALKERQQIRVVCLVYDLIPILFPTWIPNNHDTYLVHFLSVIDTADVVPCISQCTERDLRAFAERQGRKPPSTHVFYLGSDLSAEPDPAGLDPQLAKRLSEGRFALSVGTFEVRKNYGLLLDVWDRLTGDPAFDLDLVIVGMRGWEADDVIDRLQSSPLYGRRIFWVSDLADGAVSWLYERSHVALYPSLYEGWGLPVVEALQHRRPVIASNRGAVPEAGLGIARIIDPDDLDAWCEAIASTARAPRTQSPPVVPPSWDDAAASIRATLLSCTTTTAKAVAGEAAA